MKAGEQRGWPAYLFGGRLRTSTLALVIAFLATWWLYDTYQPPHVPSSPETQVVPPGFVPDPAYTWVPRTSVRVEPTETTPTTTETTETTETSTPGGAETTSGEPTTPTTGPSETPVPVTAPTATTTPTAPTTPSATTTAPPGSSPTTPPRAQ